DDTVEVSDVGGVLAAERVGLAGEAVGVVGARSSGVSGGLSGVEGDTLRSDLVLQVAEDSRIAGAEVRREFVEASVGGSSVVGEASDGALGGGEPHALGSHVGGELLNGVTQGVDVGLGQGESRVDVVVENVEEAADDQS